MSKPNWGYPAATLILKAGSDGTEGWHNLRKTGIGASDAAPLMGEGYKGTSAYTVWESKTSESLPEHDEQTLRNFARGHALEPDVADRFLEEHPDGADFRLRRCGMLRSREHEFLTASPDRFVSDGGGLELKTANQFVFKKHADAEEPPRAYYWQAVHSLLVTGKTHWYIACLNPDSFRLLWWRVDAEDPQVREDVDRLLRAARRLWDHVETGTPPDVAPTSSEEMNARITPTADALDLASGDADDRESVLALVDRRRELAAIIKPLQDEQKEIDEALKLQAGANETVIFDGEFLYSYKAITSKRLDQAALKKEHPEIAEKYMKESVSRRMSFDAPKPKTTKEGK